jgi:hypothetical protein
VFKTKPFSFMVDVTELYHQCGIKFFNLMMSCSKVNFKPAGISLLTPFVNVKKEESSQNAEKGMFPGRTPLGVSQPFLGL